MNDFEDTCTFKNTSEDPEFSFFDDNFASVHQKKQEYGSRINKANLEFETRDDGNETMQIKFMQKEMDLMDEKDAISMERDEIKSENEQLKVQVIDLATALENAQFAISEANTDCNKKGTKIIELESDLESAQEDIIKMNNKLSNYNDMEVKYHDMKQRFETMEVDYVKNQDKVKNGNNLFAEVDERRQFCENKTIEYRDEILKVRKQRDEVAKQNNILKRKMTKLQELVDSGASSKCYRIDDDPYFINVKKSALHYMSLYDKVQNESHERLVMVMDLKKRFNDEWHFPYDQKRILSRYLEVDRKYKDLEKEYYENSLKIAKTEVERDEMQYKLKVLEHFNKLPADHKCFKMKDQGTDTCEFQQEDAEKAEAGDCNQQ